MKSYDMRNPRPVRRVVGYNWLAGARSLVRWVGRGRQGCQMAKLDPFLSLDCARVEGVGAQSKERKGSNFAA